MRLVLLEPFVVPHNEMAQGLAPEVAVRAAYNHAEYLPERRRMMQEWADYLDGLKARA